MREVETATTPEADTFRDAERALFARYGLTVREQFIDLEQPRLRARVLVAGSGPPVLLIHGGFGVAAQWAPLMAQLDRYQLFAVNRSGCGLTDAWDHRTDDLHTHGSSFVRSVLDALGLEQAPIVANSMGALWAMWLAVEHPERISRLALLGCPALIAGTSAPFPMRLMSTPGLGHFMFQRMPRGTSAAARRSISMLGHAETLDQLPAENVRMMVAASVLPSYPVHFESLITRALTLAGPRKEYVFGPDLLAQLQQPVQLTWGTRDPFGSVDAARRVTELLPDGQLEIVEGGHLPWLDEPERCGQLVSQFLSADGAA